MTMKTTATTISDGTTLPFWTPSSRPFASSSGYVMMNPRAESLRITTSWLTSDGSIASSACGTSTDRSDCPCVSPTASAASR